MENMLLFLYTGAAHAVPVLLKISKARSKPFTACSRQAPAVSILQDLSQKQATPWNKSVSKISNGKNLVARVHMPDEVGGWAGRTLIVQLNAIFNESAHVGPFVKPPDDETVE